MGLCIREVRFDPKSRHGQPGLSVRKVPIVLQNSQSAVRLIFRQKTKRATIADRCVLKRATEVAGKFIAN